MKIGLNISNRDRLVRIVLGCALISAAFSPLITGTVAMGVYVIGCVAVFTGIFRFCPAYALFGVDTNRPAR